MQLLLLISSLIFRAKDCLYFSCSFTKWFRSKIIRRYTDDVKNASMVINSYLRKGEFVVFDLTRPEDDPLAICLRFDTPLNLQKEIMVRQKRKEKSASANE